MISHELSESLRSSAPASSASSRRRSSSGAVSFSTSIRPFRANIHAVLPCSPRLPLCFVNAWRISWPVRFRLSVSAWISNATPPGAYPSYWSSS